MYLEQTLAVAKKSKESFQNLPDDCPYKFKKIRKIPDHIKSILENAQMSKIEKKKILRELIEKEIQNN